MKASFSSVLLLAVLVDPALGEGNPMGCLETVPEGDLFPDKVSPQFSQEWDISYHDTYKIVTNHFANAKYVLYQCGTEPPTDVAADFINLTLSVPIQEGVALTSTTQIPHMELLGLGDMIKAYLTDDKWISDPCVNARIASGDIALEKNPSEEGTIAALFSKTGELVTFVNPTSAHRAFDIRQKVYINAYAEDTNNGVGEWHKYYSVFFNQEAEANKDFDGMSSRFECTSRNADILRSDKPKPSVIWAQFSKFCGGWSVGSCPNHYCEFVELCSATFLSNPMNGSITNPDRGADNRYMTNEEFVEFAKDADVWVYPGHGDYYWDLVYADFKEDLDKMKSVQDKKVFDTVATGLNTWYEHRLVEYDLVLEDVCEMLGHIRTVPPHTRKLMRNVFTEPVGDLGQCVDGVEPYPFRADPCVVLDISSLEGSASDESSAKSIYLTTSWMTMVPIAALLAVSMAFVGPV